jgi:hypothetical protein
VQVSTDGGTEPAWSPKGHELFYRQGDKMMVVKAETAIAVTPVAPRSRLVALVSPGS